MNLKMFVHPITLKMVFNLTGCIENVGRRKTKIDSFLHQVSVHNERHYDINI